MSVSFIRPIDLNVNPEYGRPSYGFCAEHSPEHLGLCPWWLRKTSADPERFSRSALVHPLWDAERFDLLDRVDGQLSGFVASKVGQAS